MNKSENNNMGKNESFWYYMKWLNWVNLSILAYQFYLN